MNRRALLSLLTAVCAEQLLRPSTSIANASSAKRRVIVIGAGIAGLAAAHRLRADGHEVLVIEARDRIGGRLWTSQQWPDVPIDLGASWIHGVIGNPLTKLADEANAERVETSYDSNVVYDSSGRVLSEAGEDELERLRQRLRRALLTAQDADDDASIRDVVSKLANRIGADQETLRFLNFLVSSEIEQEYAGSAERQSAHWYDSAKSFDGEDALLVKGFQVLVDHLSKGVTTQLREVVQRVEWSSDVVKVVTNRGEFAAEKVLVTLPLGVLKAGRIEFAPELPRAKSTAISKLEMGHLNKCYLRFPHVFWPDDVDWLEYVPGEHGVWTEWVSFARTLERPILLGFNAGSRGREIEAWSDQQIVDSAMQTLRTIFGPGIPSPIDHQITRWGADPFAAGSYSFNPIGSHPNMRRDLAQPVANKLYFAGEATEYEYFGTVHGAYLSGIRAASEIVN